MAEMAGQNSSPPIAFARGIRGGPQGAAIKGGSVEAPALIRQPWGGGAMMGHVLQGNSRVCCAAWVWPPPVFEVLICSLSGQMRQDPGDFVAAEKQVSSSFC